MALTPDNDLSVGSLKQTFTQYPAIHTNTVYQTALFQTRKILIDLVISW